MADAGDLIGERTRDPVGKFPGSAACVAGVNRIDEDAHGDNEASAASEPGGVRQMRMDEVGLGLDRPR